MGYNQHQIASKFTLLRKHYAAALRAIQALHGKMDDPTWLDPGWEQQDDFIKMLESWGWSVIEGGDGVIGLQWEWEKGGDEEKMLEAIAPFVASGSFIHMHGEDGAHWKWTFDGKKLITSQATIKFEGE